MPNSQDQGSSTPFIAVALLTAVAAGVFSFYEKPFDAWRPQGAEMAISAPVGPEEVTARLWQDPFEAVNQYIAKDSSSTAPKRDGHALAELAEQIVDNEGRSGSNKIIVMPVMVKGGSYAEDGEQRRRRRYAVLSALGVAGYPPIDSEHIGYFSLPWSTPRTQSAPSQALPTMLRTSLRLQNQARVATDCASPGASPRLSGEPLIIPYEWARTERRTYLVPNIFEPSKPAFPRVLVLWLDDDVFADRPVTRLATLFASLQCDAQKVAVKSGKDPPRVDFKVIGPATTTTLLAMIDEADDIKRRRAEHGPMWAASRLAPATNATFEIYSPSATASRRILLGDLGAEDQPGCEDYKSAGAADDGDDTLTSRDNGARTEQSSGGAPPKAPSASDILVEKLKAVGISFFSTNTTDTQLAKKIVCDEFARRQIYAYDPDHVVILLAEWDTLYGRALPDTFEKLLWHERQTYRQPGDEAETLIANRKYYGVWRYGYLRGLDGEVPEAQVEVSGNGTPEQTLNQEAPNPESFERPVGDIQFDYLRRLAQTIQADVDEADGEVKAVGILGSDVYDKILIMQALRDRFPKALFFTTDLDARYLHPTQLPYTRNLIVASGFGLDTRRDFRISVTPFRDSYQTATFFSVHWALGDSVYANEPASSTSAGGCDETWNAWQCALRAKWLGSPRNEWEDRFRTGLNDQLRPKLFEIGQDRPYELSQADNRPFSELLPGSQVVNWFKQPAEEISDFAAYEASSSGGGELNGQASAPDNQRVAHHGYGSPQSWFWSLSNWWASLLDAPPSLQVELASRLLTLSLLVCVLLLLVFLRRLLRVLGELKRPLEIAFAVIAAVTMPLALLALVIWWQNGEEPFSLSGGISIWPAEAIRLVAAVLSVLLLIKGHYALRRNAEGLRGRYKLEPFKKPRRDRLLRQCVFPFPPEAKTQRKVYARKLWGYYVQAPSSLMSNPTAWRVVPLSVIYTAVLIIIQLSFDYVPARGDIAYVADRLISVVATAAFALLLMYVINATLMCQRFIVHLTRRPTHYPPETLHKFAEVRRMDDSRLSNELVDWIDVQLIANRTRAVTKLIYSPFIVLLLLWASYSQIFDAWNRSSWLLGAFCAHAALAAGCQVTLRKAAEKGRRRALDRMNHRLSDAIGAEDKPRAEQLQLLIREVEQIQEGAFRPIAQQPLLKALLVPFAGASGVLLLEQLFTG